MKIGGQVMTPRGIGTLINHENSISTVNLMNEEDIISSYNFLDSEISSEFPVFLKHFTSTGVSCYKLNLPANGEVEYILNLINCLNIAETKENDFYLFYNKVELVENQTFSQIGLRHSDKILMMCDVNKKEYKINRFLTDDTDWYATPDDIIISVNKRIKLLGIGLFSTMQGYIISGTVKIYKVEGEEPPIISRGRRGRFSWANRRNASSRETILYSELWGNNPPIFDNSTMTKEKTFKINFKRAVPISPHSFYRIEFTGNFEHDCRIGTNGRAVVDGDGGVEFRFKNGKYDSNAQDGNFPEFYYSIY